MSKSKSRVKKPRPVATERDPFAQGAPPSSEDVATMAASAPSSPSSLEAMSIPPVTEDIADEPFFARDSMPVPADELEDDDDAKERALRETPEVRARVARARRIVSGLVAAAAVLLLGGAGVKLLEGKGNAAVPATHAAAAPVAAPEAKPAEPAKLEAPQPAEAPKPVAEAPKPAEPEPAKAEPTKIEPAAAPVASAAASSEAPTKTALEEKKDAQRLLDRGKSKDAIAAGERSVALDPADGEAWLLLGAAYPEQGKMADARRCYPACIKEGKRGPKGECAAMLR